MKYIEKILLATDFSPSTDLIIDYVERFSTQISAEVFGVHVIPDVVNQFSAYSADLGQEIESWMMNLKKRARTSMDEIVEKAKEWKIMYRGEVFVGEPWEEIIQEANRKDVDLIALGGTGHNPLNRFFLGSTTLKILRNSNLPVLVVGRGVRWKEVRKILVPVSMNTLSTTSIKFALHLARALDSRITFLNVLELHTYESPPETSERLRNIVEKSLEANLANVRDLIAGEVKEDESILSLKVIKSINAWTGIVTYAGEEGADMIVMNTNQRRGLSRLFLGSVTEKVVQENRFPIIVIPSSDKGGADRARASEPL